MLLKDVRCDKDKMGNFHFFIFRERKEQFLLKVVTWVARPLDNRGLTKLNDNFSEKDHMGSLVFVTVLNLPEKRRL